MAKSDWTMIRVRRETAQALAFLISRQYRGRGLLKHPPWAKGQEITYDRMIMRLVSLIESHRERGERSRAKRKAAGPAEQLPEDLDQVQPQPDDGEQLRSKEDDRSILDARSRLM